MFTWLKNIKWPIVIDSNLLLGFISGFSLATVMYIVGTIMFLVWLFHK